MVAIVELPIVVILRAMLVKYKLPFSSVRTLTGGMDHSLSADFAVRCPPPRSLKTGECPYCIAISVPSNLVTNSEQVLGGGTLSGAMANVTTARSRCNPHFGEMETNAGMAGNFTAALRPLSSPIVGGQTVMEAATAMRAS